MDDGRLALFRVWILLLFSYLVLLDPDDLFRVASFGDGIGMGSGFEFARSYMDRRRLAQG